MAKIVLTLPQGDQLCCGKQITFKVPAGCGQVDTLSIAGTDYQLVDASGASAGKCVEDFAAGALVSVLVDTDTQKAYLVGSGGASLAVLEEQLANAAVAKVCAWESIDYTPSIELFNGVSVDVGKTYRVPCEPEVYEQKHVSLYPLETVPCGDVGFMFTTELKIAIDEVPDGAYAKTLDIKLLRIQTDSEIVGYEITDEVYDYETGEIISKTETPIYEYSLTIVYSINGKISTSTTTSRDWDFERGVEHTTFVLQGPDEITEDTKPIYLINTDAPYLIYAADGTDGTDGRDGEDGYTPQKGVDYWTDEDKAEIEAYIDDKGFATEDFVRTELANLVDGAPETLDTLKEVSDALAENEEVVDALNAAIGNKADKTSVTEVAQQVINIPVARSTGGNSIVQKNASNVASAGQTTALGTGTQATVKNQVVIGSYNNADANAAFIVGDGTSEGTRSNIFVVKKSGDVIVRGSKKLVDSDTFDNLVGSEDAGKTVRQVAQEVMAAGATITSADANITNGKGNNALVQGKGANTNRATGRVSTVFGTGTVATHENTIAAGKNSLSSGAQAFSMGIGAFAAGNGSCALGEGPVSNTVTSITLDSDYMSKFTTDLGNELILQFNDGSYLKCSEDRKTYGYYDANNNEISLPKTDLSLTIKSATFVSDYSNDTNGERQVFSLVKLFKCTTSNSQGVTGAFGHRSHSEGANCTSSGFCSHSEGSKTDASNFYAHSEGVSTIASGEASHAQNNNAKATGRDSHAEGYNTTASGVQSHAQGHTTVASGAQSFAAGYFTQAKAAAQTALGRYNADNSKALLLIGDGYVSGQNIIRRNAFEVIADNGNYALKVGNTTISEAQLIALLNLLG